jgi:hypothetical protein
VLLPAAHPQSYAEAQKPTEIAILPARPIVLGGDDLTIIVRADLALPFAARLLGEIASPMSADAPASLSGSQLSACAGLAVVKAGQPFLMAYGLAESLSSFAKREAKRDHSTFPYPSMLAFHNAQSTLQEDYEETILAREKIALGTGLRLTANPLAVGSPDNGRPSYQNLRVLADALGREPRGLGHLIEMCDQIALGRDGPGITTWRRWREMLGKRNRSVRDRIDEALKAFSIVAADDVLPITAREPRICPIPDALELIDLGVVELARQEN